MAYEEYIRAAIAAGKTYSDLPPKIQSVVSNYEWKTRVKEYCIQKGFGWASSAACNVCTEQEYYDDLVKTFRNWGRLYPYHLADYISRVLRITPFKYYREALFSVMREEKSYDRIPNFTAADALRLTGIGRNEFISIMNQCKARKLYWRVNKSIARELLPTVPLDVRLEPWWVVNVVNVGEAEYRELSKEEADMLQFCCDDEGQKRVKQLDLAIVMQLHRKGLVYFDIPVQEDDRFAIPPLEGFVSNKTSEAGDSSVDPIETLLYSVFVANSERMRVSDLATILNVDINQLICAMSIACRLGFATRIQEEHTGVPRPVSTTPPNGLVTIPENESSSPCSSVRGSGASAHGGLLADLAASGALLAGAQGHNVAVVVDAEATSYLMMGALSPGLKKHSVTLFEGGRVTGEEVMKELVTELWASYKAGQEFEGDMLRLTNYAAALATLLETVREASGGRAIELLRKESLAELRPVAACKVLSHAYCAIVPIAPLPSPPLPLTPDQPGPAYYGPTLEAASPWLQLAIYATARSGPLTVVFTAGQRVWRLPPQLQHCTHALVLPWDAEPRLGPDGAPNLVEGTFLLYTLNDILSRTAVMVQPIVYDGFDGSSGSDVATVVDVPLPLATAAPAAVARPGADDAAADDSAATAPTSDAAATGPGSTTAAASSGVASGAPGGSGRGSVAATSSLGAADSAAGSGGADAAEVCGIDGKSGSKVTVRVPSNVLQTLRTLGLNGSVGFLRMLQLPGGDPDEGPSPPEWLPLNLQLGVPLYCLELCRLVCEAAAAAGFLSAEGRAAQQEGQLLLQEQLLDLVAQYGSCSASTGAVVHQQVELPTQNLIFDGTDIQIVDLSDCLQGLGCTCPAS